MKISISYRRNDSDAITGRIFDRLVAHYGEDAVFRDIDNIPPGIDFRKHINRALENTNVLLAIIGPQWKGKTASGSRIEDPTDLVRIEIEVALRKDIPLIPVLVGNTPMPDPKELPEGMKDFAFRQAVKVDALEDFDDHVRRLIRSLDRLFSDPPPNHSSEDQQASQEAAGQARAKQQDDRTERNNAERWIATLENRKGSSFSITLAKGHRSHKVEFRPRMLRSDQLLIDNSIRSALRWPGRTNRHKFVLDSNSDELFTLSYFVDMVLLNISAIELTCNDERILFEE
jgi:hypothetical protein